MSGAGMAGGGMGGGGMGGGLMPMTPPPSPEQGGGFQGMGQFPAYTPPKVNVNPKPTIDLKGPLAQFAMGMVQRSMQGQQGPGPQPQPHNMGLAPLGTPVRNPYAL